MRWLLLLLYPLLHLSVVGGWWWFHIRHQEQYYAMPEMIGLAHVIVYLISVPVFIPGLRAFSASRLAAFTLAAALLGVAASIGFMLLWATFPRSLDGPGFVLVPIVAPLLGMWCAMRVLRRGGAPAPARRTILR